MENKLDVWRVEQPEEDIYIYISLLDDRKLSNVFRKRCRFKQSFM